MRQKIQSELPRIITDAQAKKLMRLVKFVVPVYVPCWVTCPIAADSPIHELKLLKAIRAYPLMVPN